MTSLGLMSSEDIKDNAWKIAQQYGIHTILLMTAVWFMWKQNEVYRTSRESELSDLKKQVQEDSLYIRTELVQLVKNTTDALENTNEALAAIRQDIANANKQ